MPDDGSAHGLTWLETFISNNYSKQSAWVRTVVFLVLVGVLVFGLYRTIGGDFDLKGRVLEKISDAELHVPSNWYEVQLGQQSFGVCRNGDYRIILTWVEYLGAIGSGKLSVQVFLPNGGVETQNLTVHRLGYQDLDDIVIPIAATALNAPGRAPTSGRALPGWLPSFTAHAAAPPRTGAKLMLESIAISSGASAAREVDVTLGAYGSPKPLLLKPTNDPSGPVTVVPGKIVTYNDDHFFALDSAPPNGVSQLGDLTIASQHGFLQSGYAETFHLPSAVSYGAAFDAPGSNGSHIRLRLVYPWTVQIYDRAEIPGGAAALKQALLDRGFDSRPIPMPPNASTQPNLLSIARAVPLQSAQSILAVLRDHGVRLKKVQRETDQTQLSGSKDLDNAPELGDARLEKMISATNDAEFNQAACCAIAVQQQMRRAPKK